MFRSANARRQAASARAGIAMLTFASLAVADGCTYNDVLLPEPQAPTYDLLVEESDPISNRVQLAVRDLRTGFARGVFGLLVSGAMPSASPDGSLVVYVGEASGTSEYDYQDLWRVTRGGQPQRIPLGEGTETAPTISPDGRRIAYIKLDELSEGRLYIADMDGSNERLIVPAMPVGPRWRYASPSWSPDGTRLLFSAGEPGRLHLYISRADGTAVQQITNAALSDIDGAWSPDGQSIAFVRIGSPAVSWVMTRTLSSGAERTFQVAHRSRHPAWSPDGRRIAFVSNMEDNLDLELYTIGADGEGLQRYTWDDLRQQSPRWLRR